MKRFIVQQVRDFPYKVISRFKNLRPENAISLFCDPRGGSTWLAEVLNAIPNSMIVEEPLSLGNVPELKKLGFSWRQYIPENEIWSEAKSVFQLLLEGRKLNARICRINSIVEVKKSDQLILKIIRGKALLPWYVRQFDFKYKPLVMVRHPFAIAASLLNHSSWNYPFKKLVVPEGPFNEFYKNHKDFLGALQTKEEQLTALWCMVNNVVLNHPDNDHSWITINYENLVLEPQKYFQKIFDLWGMDLPEELMKRISVPSTSTKGKRSVEPDKLISDWKKKLTEKQISRLQKVLDHFEVDYYNKTVTPTIAANEVHLKNVSS